MIAGNWKIAQLALQIIAEQGPGNAIAQVEEQELALLSSRRRAHG